MSGAGVAVAAAIVISGYMSSEAQKDAAESAYDAQEEGTTAAIAEQQRQFAAIQELLSPYVSAGESALSQQLAIAGLSGDEAQGEAISGIQSSSLYKALQDAGEESILQSAAATGGLRGGNTQSALAEYSSSLLQSQIESQYSMLSGLSSLGQASAAQEAATGTSTSSSISDLLTSLAEAEAQSELLSGSADASAYSSLGSLATYLYGQNQYSKLLSALTSSGSDSGSF